MTVRALAVELSHLCNFAYGNITVRSRFFCGSTFKSNATSRAEVGTASGTGGNPYEPQPDGSKTVSDEAYATRFALNSVYVRAPVDKIHQVGGVLLHSRASSKATEWVGGWARWVGKVQA